MKIEHYDADTHEPMPIGKYATIEWLRLAQSKQADTERERDALRGEVERLKAERDEARLEVTGLQHEADFQRERADELSALRASAPTACA